MKKLQFMLALGVVILTSCATEAPDAPVDPEAREVVPLEVIAQVQSIGTRATATQFEPGDQIGITPTSVASSPGNPDVEEGDDMFRYKNVRYTKGEDGVFRADGSGGLFFENADTYEFSAYYPFYGTPGEDQNFEINTFDSQDDNARKILDIMTAKKTHSKAQADAGTKLNFTGDNAFKHLMSRVIFRVSFDKETFKDYDDNRIPDIETYLENSKIQICGLVHSAIFDTREVSFIRKDEVDDRVWDLNTAQAPKRINTITSDASGNPITPYKVLEYEVLVIPHQTDAKNVRMALVYKDGTKYESDGFEMDLPSGVTAIFEMKVHRRKLEITEGGTYFKNWEDGDSGTLETPTGEKE